MVIEFFVGLTQVTAAFPTAWRSLEVNSLANVRAPPALLLPGLGPPETSVFIRHGSSPFSNWEITPGLESWYPAYKKKKLHVLRSERYPKNLETVIC